MGLQNAVPALRASAWPSMAITHCGQLTRATFPSIIIVGSANRTPVPLVEALANAGLILLWEINLLPVLQKQKQVPVILHLPMLLPLELLIVLRQFLSTVCAPSAVLSTCMARHVAVALSAALASLSTIILLSAYVVKLVSMNKSNNIPPTTAETKRTNARTITICLYALFCCRRDPRGNLNS